MCESCICFFTCLFYLFLFSFVSFMDDIKTLLRRYAEQYETADFLPADPSWFMHQVEGVENQEVTAFVASCLSYGSRKQFMPKIQFFLDVSEGDMYDWLLTGNFKDDVPDDDKSCFYRLYTWHTMYTLLVALRQMLQEYGSIGKYVKTFASDGFAAVKCITDYFSNKGIETIIPKNTTSACKRVCMFLRWMVRDGSPVDLGLWSHFIDKRTLIIPMDTHVLQEANRLGLIDSKTASMTVARKLSARLAGIFPDDPMKGDFALFGYGVNR